jgi:hypothetical protein
VFYGSCLFINLWYWEVVPAESVMCVTTHPCNLQNDCIHRNYLFLSSYPDLHLWFQVSPLWKMLVNSVYSSPGFWILPHSLSIHIFSGLGWTKIPLSAVTDTVLLRKVAFELKPTVYKNKLLFRTLICSKNKLLFSELSGTTCSWITSTRSTAALSPTKDESWLPRVSCQWVWGSELLWRSYWHLQTVRHRIIFYTFF